MKPIHLFTIALTILLTVALLSSSPTPDYVGIVEWIVDGDTIIMDNGVHVRLLDINTPELNTSEGVAARSFMINLVYNKTVSLFCDGYDKYDRWLCTVVLDGINVGSVLVARGLARYWVNYSTT